jgi:hypothetical protein
MDQPADNPVEYDLDGWKSPRLCFCVHAQTKRTRASAGAMSSVAERAWLRVDAYGQFTVVQVEDLISHFDTLASEVSTTRKVRSFHLFLSLRHCLQDESCQ